MDQANRDQLTERRSLNGGPGDYTPIAADRIVISGPCVVCRKETESVVRADTNTVMFLCRPCGKAIREGRPV